jgi:hypothetical protein
MADPGEDPVKAAEFQKVIRHFVTTPHRPHEPLKKRPKAAKKESKVRDQPPSEC